MPDWRWFSCLLLNTSLSAQVITTIAGGVFQFPRERIPAKQASIGEPSAIAIDGKGNLLIALIDHSVIARVSNEGVLEIIGGNGVLGFSGEGADAHSAATSSVLGMTADTSGAVFFSDYYNHRVRRIAPDGRIDTVAGNGHLFLSLGGTALTSSIGYPRGVVTGPGGEFYFVEDDSSRVVRVSAEGKIAVVAGNGRHGFAGDGGPATAASLRSPTGIAIDASGNLFIADWGNDAVRKVTPEGIIQTVAGNGKSGFLGDGGPATAASLNKPAGVAVDASGNLYIADSGNERVRRVSPSGIIETIAGSSKSGYSGDGGPATAANLNNPSGLAVDASGRLYIADQDNRRVRRILPNGTIETVAGNGSVSFPRDGNPATAAYLDYPRGLAVDSSGAIFVSDSDAHRVRRIGLDGVIQTVTGNGQPGDGGDGGPAASASLHSPEGIAVAPSGILYVTDRVNHRIRAILPEGRITTVAGNGQRGYSGDGGQATAASLSFPTDVAVDAAGNLYIADLDNLRVRKVTPDGRITTFAGNGRDGFSGDGGPAAQAAIDPEGIGLDRAGNLYIADGGNNRIRRVTPDGIISTVAGTGRRDCCRDGAATSAFLNAPSRVTVDAQGNLFIADTGNNLIRRVTPGGTIDTVAGDKSVAPDFGFCCDGGLATDALLDSPLAVAIDKDGGLLIADTSNHRIRKVLAKPPSISVTPAALSFSANSGGPVPPPQRLIATSAIPSIAFTVSATTAAGGRWLTIDQSRGETPRAMEITVDPADLTPGIYSATIIVRSPLAAPLEQRVDVTFTVGPSLPGRLRVETETLSFVFPRGSSARTQTVRIANLGSGTLSFTATPVTTTGGQWLAVSPAAGSATPRRAAELQVTADPAGLGAGTYRGAVQVVTPAGEVIGVPTTLIVSEFDQAIQLSQSGLSFTAVQGGGVVPPQTFGVFNTGRGSMSWAASTSTLSGGPGWLNAGPASGATDAGAALVPEITVRVDPTGLPAGRYYGLVRVDSADAANTPHVVTAYLDVLRPGENPGAVTQPAELIFRAPEDLSPASQELTIYNLTSAPVSYRARNSRDWLWVGPFEGTVDPQVPLTFTVQPFVQDLNPGSFRDSITFQFSDGVVRSVPVQLIVTPARGNSAKQRNAGECRASRLIPAVQSLGQSSSVPGGWPTALSIQVKDDCGAPMTDGSVVVSFSNGDPPVGLQSLKDGRWHGTWQNRDVSSPRVTLRISATQPEAQLQGAIVEQVELSSSEDPPLFQAHSVVSALNPEPYVPLAPGSLIAINGERLSESVQPPQTPPLPDNLAGARVLIAGRAAPLLSVTPQQLNAIIPFDVPGNTTHQILIGRGQTYSNPVLVTVAPAQPAILRDPQGDGQRALVIVVRGTEQFRATTQNPATAGDHLTIFATGLGAIQSSVPAGNLPMDSSAAATRQPAHLVIAGQEANVSFAGLSPMMVGIYQVSATMPERVDASNDAPITLEVAGQVSPVSTLPVK